MDFISLSRSAKIYDRKREVHLKLKNTYPRLVIAGLRGGSGKTTLSLGLISAWRRQGLTIAPYKKGPDYIDAGWLSSAAGRECYNLDPFLIGGDKIVSSFCGHFGAADAAVIEGNRGLYDGMDASGTYSTAELAKLLKSPVLLILDCTKTTRTAAAMVAGMQKFDNKVLIRGVVLNRIAGSRHEKIIRETIEKYCGIPVLGAIPKLRQDLMSERHMGLTPFQEHPDVSQAVEKASEIALKYLDLPAILEMARKTVPLSYQADSGAAPRSGAAGTVIGIIRDAAFQFYYPENFEELLKGGATLVEINAMTGKKLPDIDALYIGGGFPETNAVALAKNIVFRKALRSAVEAGLPVYAECGGLMYLGKSISVDNRKYPMSGVFPLEFSLEKKPQAHGYTIVEVKKRNPFYPVGTVLKGHEFHYSKVIALKDQAPGFAFGMKRGEGITGGRDGIVYKNTLATYTHLHAYGSPEWAAGMLRRALLYKRKKSRNPLSIAQGQHPHSFSLRSEGTGAHHLSDDAIRAAETVRMLSLCKSNVESEGTG